jgi:hypothetical protein
LGILGAEEGDFAVGVVDPCNFMNEVLVSLVRYREHVPDLSRVHEINAVDNEGDA